MSEFYGGGGVSTSAGERRPIALTRDWGTWRTVSLYLDRCQVDTPSELVKATWRHVQDLRTDIGKVVDFGAGDGRFACQGKYEKYLGFEIDPARCSKAILPVGAALLNQCAFSEDIEDADVCIGNPPFVRNQDLPSGWRQRTSKLLAKRTGVKISGLANAWQYFFLLSLASLKDDGLCALVIPYEWVSRPAAATLRSFILERKWNVSVYRLVDTTFESVLTTSSITIVDKSKQDGVWSYYEETKDGRYVSLPSPSGGAKGTIKYGRRSDAAKGAPRAVRGLSPGTQKVLTLTEGERVRCGLRIGGDVVPCVTTLRNLPNSIRNLDVDAFRRFFRDAGQKCWLIRTDKKFSPALRAYIRDVPPSTYQTATCLEREQWWAFRMPPIPQIVMSQCFRGSFPKSVKNTIAARAVGGVCGIYNLNRIQVSQIISVLSQTDIRKRIVAHSNGLRKIEINQLNTLIADFFSSRQSKKSQ